MQKTYEIENAGTVYAKGGTRKLNVTISEQVPTMNGIKMAGMQTMLSFSDATDDECTECRPDNGYVLTATYTLTKAPAAPATAG